MSRTSHHISITHSVVDEPINGRCSRAVVRKPLVLVYCCFHKISDKLSLGSHTNKGVFVPNPVVAGLFSGVYQNFEPMSADGESLEV